MKINIHRECEIESTIRTELLSSMFEVPAKTKLSVTLTGELPLEEKKWNIGLIVGPSGSGKTVLLESLIGKPYNPTWNSKSIIDDFDKEDSMEEISRVCQSVGFNTIPSWLRPYSVLSNGEKFRATLARQLLLKGSCIIIDEFTSVVDRQVAQIASNAVQKYVRSNDRTLVVASCHYDIIPWLQPDWILEPGNPCRFTWRSLCPRPPISVSVSRCNYETWKLFREFHYMTTELNRAARCYGLYVANTESAAVAEKSFNEGIHSHNDGSSDTREDGSGLRISSAVSSDRVRDKELVLPTDNEELCNESVSNEQDSVVSTAIRNETRTYRIASMCGVLYRPHPRVSDIYGFTRMVTLPDFQGLGLAFVLACKVASAYKALGKRLHSYPNHPAWIRSYQRSSLWMQVKESGSFSPRRGVSSTVGGFGGRRCAVFQYIGDAMNKEDAERLIHVD